MTLKTSLAKKSQLLNFFVFTLKKQTPLTLLVTAFALLICPGMLLSDANDNLMTEYTLDAFDFGSISFFIMATASLLVFMLLLHNFSYLFSKKAGDMYNALPITRNEMLLARTFGAFIGGLFLMTASYIGLVMINSLPTVDGVGADTALRTYLFMLLCLTAITLFCLIFVICSGGYFDTVIAAGAINLAPVFIVALLFLVAEEITYGLVIDYSFLIYLSPIAFMFYKLLYLPEILEKKQLLFPSVQKTSVVSVIAIAVFALLCAYIAERLFKIRKSETAGDAYSFKFMSVIISLLVSMVGGFVIAGILTGFNSNFDLAFWLLFIVCDILCAIAIGAITNRGFKNIKNSVISGSIAAVLMIVFVVSGMHIAEYNENKIPKASSIEQVYFGDVELTNDIEMAVSLHKGILECINSESEEDGYYPYPEVVSNLSGFDFKYILKNGSIVKRNYWYRSPDMSDLHGELLKVLQSDSFFERYESCIELTSGGLIQVYSFSSKFGSMDDNGESKSAALTVSEAKELMSLFKKEMKESNTDIFKEETYGVSLTGIDFREVYIPSSFDETIGFLEAKFSEYALEE